ncbi:MAG TPA: glutathione S-transferase family protein [Rhodocyclaceae bacterium]|nr:glutathione S-transferase family protein [Rhodocyclaceae bacterium]
MQLIIGNKNYSSWSLRGWLAAKASGLPFEETHILLGQPDTRQQILAFSPSGKVPCLIDHGLTVWDSLAIAEYLAERAPGMWPRDAAMCAVARSVSAEMHSGFAALRSQMPMNIRKNYAGHGRTPEVMADIERIVSLWNDCRARYGKGGPYLFGGYSIADIMFAPVCFRFATYGVAPGGKAQDYLATMLAHPHMKAWQQAALCETAVIPHEDLYD